jgi:hypothetical protein
MVCSTLIEETAIEEIDSSSPSYDTTEQDLSPTNHQESEI